MVRGEPGIGKTWLAEEAAARAARARRAGARRPLLGSRRCAAVLALGAVPAPARRTVRTAVLAAQLDAGAADVARIVPELRELGRGVPRPSGRSGGARFRLFEAVVTLLRGVARARPIVVVLEDLHAADSASLLLLRYLTDSLADMRVLVIATRRERDPAADPDVAANVAAVARSGRYRDMPLDGLGPDEVARLVARGRVHGAGCARRGHPDRAEGHPLFVAELARLLAATGRLDTIPPGIHAAVAQRVGLLSEECRRLLRLAAVVGRDFTSGVLARAGDATPETIVVAARRGDRGRGLVPVPGAPGRFRFAHALVRDALYDEVSPAARMRLHRAVAEALEAIHAAELEPHVARLAHHYFLATPGDSAYWPWVAVRAAERATAELAYEEAARLYDRGEAHELEPAADPITRGELILGLAPRRPAPATDRREADVHPRRRRCARCG